MRRNIQVLGLMGNVMPIPKCNDTLNCNVNHGDGRLTIIPRAITLANNKFAMCNSLSLATAGEPGKRHNVRRKTFLIG